ncbi:MAG: ParB N-terminal domain-containing protein [Rhodosalinus sp.]
MLRLDQIRTDGGTQSRAAINEQTVAEYAEAMGDEATVFPPVIVYHDGRDYWLADGFHRLAAWERVGRVEVPAEVRQGDRRRAILHSVAANSKHGLRRTNDDKRRAVLTLLEDEEWGQWSDREIARQCGVTHPFVAKLRRELRGDEAEGGNGYHPQGSPDMSSDDSLASRPRSETEGASTAGPEEPDGGSRGSRPPAGRSAGASGEGVSAEEGDEPAAGGSPAQEPEPDRPDTGAEPEPEPEPPADPYGYAKLTEAALLDTANGLRADLDEARAKMKALKQERDTLKARLDEALAADDMGRALGNAQRQRDTMKGRLDELQARNAVLQRRINKQDAEIKKLRKQLERQEIEL